MKISTLHALALTAAALVTGAQAPIQAQTAPVVQIPFTSAYAGLPTGGSGTACTSVYPTFVGTSVGDGCLPTQAKLSTPSSSAIDAYGNVYISDYGNKLIRVVYAGGSALANMLAAASPAIPNLVPVPGHIYTLAGAALATLTQTGSPSKAYYCNVAGTGTVGLSSNGDGCPATEAYVQPRGMAIDSNGNLFFANLAGGESLRVVYAGGAAVSALITIENPTVTTPQVGFVYSISGSSTAGFKGDGANARAAAFENVRDVAVDASGNIYISDGNAVGSLTNNDVRVVNGTTGIITTFAGGSLGALAACPTTGTVFAGDGGPATAATLNSPYVIFLDASQNLYLADSCNGRLRVVYAGGTIPGIASPVVGNIYTVAGGGTVTAGNNIAATQLSIALMQSAGIDAQGNLYVADSTNRYAWQINPITGIARLYAGLGATGSPAVAVPAAAAGVFCAGATATAGPKSTDTLGDGCPSLQSTISPSLRFIGDNAGHVYAIESTAGILREYSLNDGFSSTAVGSTTTQPLAFNTQATDLFTLEGTTSTEFADAGGGACSATAASVGTLCTYNVAFNPRQAGPRLGSMQLGTPATVAPLVGIGLASQLAVDTGTRTTLGSGLSPLGLAVDLSGNLYVADATSNQVKLFAPGASTSTTAVTGLNKPHAVAIDGNGNLFIADTGNNRVVERALGASSVTSIGTNLSAPQGVTVDGFGNVYIADTGNNRILELVGGTNPQVLPFTGLSGPTSLALDPAGNLYVADAGNNRVVELPANNPQLTVNLGGSFSPVAVATDAAGDLYVVDASGLQVLEFAPGNTLGNTLVNTLQKPVGLAVDGNGSLYIADSAATGVLVDNRALGAIGFPLTNVGQPSNASITVGNAGNAALLFAGPQLTSATGSTATFAVASASSSGCALNTPVNPGSTCLLTATFTPTARGAVSETLTLLANAANATTTHALLSGTGAQLIATSTTIANTTSATGTVAYGTPVVIAATVSLSTPSGTPAGTITLSIDGKAQAPVAYGTGTVATTLNLPVGTHAVTALFSGDTVYASSGASLTFTVTRAATATTLTLTPSAPGGNPTVSFASVVSSATASGETGTISFYSGTTLLGTSTITGTGATYLATNVSFPAATFTAVYSGDANFAGSTSSTVTPSPDFAISSSGTTLATAQGGVAQASVTLTPLYNLTGTITPTCTSLPTNSLCRFQPTTITLSGTTPVGASIEIYTNVSSSTAGLLPAQRPTNRRQYTALAASLLACLGLSLRRRRTAIRLAALLLIAGAGLVATTGITGCASTNTDTFVTPTGTQSVSITFTSSGTTPVTHALTFNLTVNTP